MEVFLLST